MEIEYSLETQNKNKKYASKRNYIVDPNLLNFE